MRSLLALSLLLLACGSSAPAAPPGTAQAGASGLTRIRMGVTGGVSGAGIYIASEKGYFKEQGLEMELTRFPSGAEQVAPLASGLLDIAGGGTSLGFYQALERGARFRIVADKGNTHSPEWDYVALVLRKDLFESGRVRNLEDFRGLTVTATGIGAATEIALFTGLARAHVTPGDVTFIGLGNADMPAAFANHSIAAGMVAEPTLTRIESQGTAIRFKGNSELLGRTQYPGLIIFSEQFAANPDVARRWMTAYIKGLRDYNDAFQPPFKGRDEIIQILIKSTTVKERPLYDQMKPAGLDPDGKLDAEYFKFEVDYYKKTGVIDLSTLIDTSFQDYAVRQLGLY